MSNYFEFFDDDKTKVSISDNSIIHLTEKISNRTVEIPKEVFVDIAVQLIGNGKEGMATEYYKKKSYKQLIEKYISKCSVDTYTLYYQTNRNKSYELSNYLVWYMEDNGTIIAFYSSYSEYESDKPETFYLKKYNSFYDLIDDHAYVEDKRIIFPFSKLNDDLHCVKWVIDNFLNNSFENYITWGQNASKKFYFELESNSYYLVYDHTKTFIHVAKYQSPEFFPILTPLKSLSSDVGCFYIYTEYGKTKDKDV